MTEFPVDKTKLIIQLESLLLHPNPWTLRERLGIYLDKIKEATQTT